MNKTRLKAYAKLIARCGVNVQKGQEVIVRADLDQPEFVKLVVEECYKAGAGEVVVNFSDMTIDKYAQIYQSEENLSRLAPWDKARWQWMTEKFPARIWLDSDDPDGMNGIDQEKYSRSFAKKVKEIKRMSCLQRLTMLKRK